MTMNLTARTVAVLAAMMATEVLADAAKHDADVHSDEAYYVIRVRPSDTSVTIKSGEIQKGEFVSKGWRHSKFASSERDGSFIVGKLDRDGPAAIVEVEFYAHRTDKQGGEKAASDIGRMLLGFKPSFATSQFAPCGNNSIVFDVPAGKVLYVGTVDYILNSGTFDPQDELSLSTSSDLEGARAYLAAHFPLLESKLEQGSFQKIPVEDC